MVQFHGILEYQPPPLTQILVVDGAGGMCWVVMMGERKTIMLAHLGIVFGYLENCSSKTSISELEEIFEIHQILILRHGKKKQ